MWRNRGWAEFTSRHHGFGWTRGECMSNIYGKLVLLSHCFPGLGKSVPPRQLETPSQTGELLVSMCRFVVNCRCQSRVSCFCAGPEGNWMCRKMLRPGTWMMCPGALWALLCRLVIHGPGSRHCAASPALAVQNKLRLDMHAFLADIILVFSCTMCHRLNDAWFVHWCLASC